MKSHNPKGAGRNPSPNPRTKTNFYCDDEIIERLKNWQELGFKSKADLMNFALKNFLDTYENPNDEKQP